MTDAKKGEIAGVEVSKSDVDEARKDGVLEHVKDASKRDAETGLNLPAQDERSLERMAEQQKLKVDSSLPSTFIAPLLDLNEEDLKRRVTDEDAEDFIPFEQVKMLLSLERGGKNRTGIVKLLIDAISKVIGRKVHPHEVTPAGPAYTNDTHNVTDL